ncbi:hypothetical protein [uncultured Legionella sp.]|uniref:hypothetical protein n=1 Tax=uncultured Legionella sp. TaxID=210934 RepID=UPI00261C43AF|nr:hypothetical protein [uncultured Legionella sp.]
MVTLFLATVIGWYLVIVSLFTLCRYEQVKSISSEILGNRGLFFIVALITLILGLLMVVSHNIWVMGWPVLITLISWLVLISGLLRLLCAGTANRMGQSFLANPTRMKTVSLILLIIGVFLLLQVYYPLA